PMYRQFDKAPIEDLLRLARRDCAASAGQHNASRWHRRAGEPTPDGGCRRKVVVVGGGFGGLPAALHLARRPGDVTLIDGRTFIFATGAQYNYFGHDRWRMPAPNLKTLEGALAVRRRILSALEAAELEPDPQRRASWLTFVIIGGGPTGVEMAGQIAEIAQDM